MTEELTDLERSALDGSGWGVSITTGQKAVRIIDAHAADRAALVGQLEDLKRQLSELDVARDVAQTRFTEAEAQVSELTLERDEARVQRDEAAVSRHEFQQQVAQLQSRDRTRDDFVSELQRNTAAAETEVARLKEALAAAERKLEIEHADAMQQRADHHQGAAEQLRESLTAANALLGEISESNNTGRSWRGAIRAHLTNQPTAPATRQVRDLGSLGIADGLDEPAAPPRTEAEQRVLEIGRAVLDMQIPAESGGDFYFDQVARRKLWDLCELARRGLKP